MHRSVILGAIGLTSGLILSAALAAPEAGKPKDKTPGENSPAKSDLYDNVSIRGKVVWLSDVLKRRFKVDLDPDASKSQAVLETPAGELYPIVKEFRGRGFWNDERLRGIDVELEARKFRGTNFLQVIRVCTWKKDQKYEFDYWCDICAIPMYELKECECCQGPIRTRERLIPPGKSDPLPEK